MCGIIITKRPERIPQIDHRGIQSRTIYRSEYFFSHRRLPIQTLEDDDLLQPLMLQDGGMLMYNGEIFNYPSQYKSDVEYLIHLFNSFPGPKDGKSFFHYFQSEVNRWDGFWSLVYVGDDGTGFCLTDPLGKKQLYYSGEGNTLELCSEIRPLINNNTLFSGLYKSGSFKWGYRVGRWTPFNNIFRVEPGIIHAFDLNHGTISICGDYQFDWTIPPSSNDLKDLVVKAVQSRLISAKYDIGVLVSGGLDSSIIAAVLDQIKAKVNYYTIDNGEEEYVKILMNHLGTGVNYLVYQVTDDNLKECLKWNETPIDLGSLVPQHQIMGVIPEKIVMTGDGADELFGGYKRSKVYDSQRSDIFDELTHYHLPRLDRASMRYTIELRNPFLSHDLVKFALKLPRELRTDKKILKDIFSDMLPKEIIDRPKLPLKNPVLVEDPDAYRAKVFDLYYNEVFKHIKMN